MDFRKLFIGRAASTAFLVLIVLGSQAQPAPPSELNLHGKVRDFREKNAGSPTATAHPHFYGNSAYDPDCDAQKLGVYTVQPDIDTTDQTGDTSVFKGDHRGPRLLASLPAGLASCYDPIGRFTDWYNDRPTGDVNRSFLTDIRLKRNSATGLYEFFENDYFPIDEGKSFRRLGALPPFGHLLPPPHEDHNFGFTMEFHANFTYFQGRNQIFKFSGDDDVWVFINGKRVIDLGGIHARQDAEVNLDQVAAAIGLKDSLVYPLDFFFAERKTENSTLRITTSLELEPLLGKPTLTPGRDFEEKTVVVITHPSPDAVIHYTTDGTEPTAASPIYTGPITVTSTTVIKAIAVRPGYPSSPVSTATYTKVDEHRISIKVTNPIVERESSANQSLSSEARRNPFAVLVSLPAGAEICLVCPPGRESEFLASQSLPEWVVRAKYPVRYAFRIYDHLGGFVAGTEGKLTAAQLLSASRDPDGYHALKFRWQPVARNGAAAATGAYILKGWVGDDSQGTALDSGGDTLKVTGRKTSVLTRFGYLRR